MLLKILPGSIVCGKSGTPLRAVAIDGDIVVTESSKGLARVKRSAILRILSPPPAPDRPLKIGDRLRRKPAIKIHYPKKWHEGAVDERSMVCGSIATATIIKFSDSGYWLLTPDKRKFHVSPECLADGVWERIETDDQNNN
jgi:hypothetical protein